MGLTKEHAEKICKLGQSSECCKYLAYEAGEFHCEKLGPSKGIIDSKELYLEAKGDNCKGEPYEETK